jgi:hypothetical protein
LGLHGEEWLGEVQAGRRNHLICPNLGAAHNLNLAGTIENPALAQQAIAQTDGDAREDQNAPAVAEPVLPFLEAQLAATLCSR